MNIPIDPPAVAQQAAYRDGVPHTDRLGKLRRAYDPAQSFFPIGIFHAVHGEAFGQQHDLSLFASSGFNTVHLWPQQDLDAAIDAAERLRLQVIIPLPNESFAERRKGSPAMLAWMLEEEPSMVIPKEHWPARLAEFEARVARFKAFDPWRANLVVDTPGLNPNIYWGWRAWLERGDIHAQFNYPFHRARDPVPHFERLAGAVSRAVRVNGGTKPVWFISQAFDSPVYGWYMPTAHQLRALIFTALVHGATGIIHFGYDSHGMRDGDVSGISPSPVVGYEGVPDYDKSGRPGLRLDEKQLAASRALWQEVVTINRDLAAVAPSLLQPTADLTCHVQAEGRHQLPQPIRLLAKPLEGRDLLLIAVNIEAIPLDALITCDKDIGGIAPFAAISAQSATPKLESQRRFRDKFSSLGVHVYRVTMP